MLTRSTVVVLSLLLVVVGVLAACASPAPTPSPSPTPTLTPTATPTGALAQVIAGAKKEGSVSAILKSTLTPSSIERLKREIKQRFGVDLDIKFTPSGYMPRDMLNAIMEHQAGATPTYDLMVTYETHIVEANAAGILETVDWKPLLLDGTNPEVVRQHPVLRNAIVNYTGIIGLMYNPEKVTADKVPQTLRDLADPRFRGKVAIMSYTGTWARWAFVLGKEKLFADLRGILKNQAIQGAYTDEYNRYVLGEIWMALVTSSYLRTALDKGMPAAWQPIDFAELTNFSLILRKGVPHPNAAKLVSVYLASPAGARFMLEEGGGGNLHYPGNFEHDLLLQGRRLGIPEYFTETYPGLLEFQVTNEYQQWLKEVELILKTGG